MHFSRRCPLQVAFHFILRLVERQKKKKKKKKRKKKEKEKERSALLISVFERSLQICVWQVRYAKLPVGVVGSYMLLYNCYANA